MTNIKICGIISKSSRDDAIKVSGCGAAGSALPWGGRGRKFKSCHSDQKSVRMHNSCGFFLFVIVHIQHISGLFSFYNLFSTYKVHTTKGMYTIYERYVLNQCTKSEKALLIKSFRIFTSTFHEGRGFNLRPLLKFPW